MNFRHALDCMPQKGLMLLIDEILEADETSISCRARDHRSANYPLRVAGHLMPVALTEIGAQAAAAHASLFGVGGHHTGLLLALHQVEVLRSAKDPLEHTLTVDAEQLFLDENGARYRFAVRDQAGDVLRGEAMLMMRATER